ncbi:TPM domain-containing protein [Chamaesiphon sp.]|uniref:TPM domain-containing protein n=1 Tax=Chamaesiphon sp. TaxID=2814140 RepID=UPI003593D106
MPSSTMILRRLIGSALAIVLSLSVWSIAPAAQAFDNPELLPTVQTPVIDLAKTFTAIQEENLVKDINTFEADTGWKLRVLTQYDRTPGRAVRKYWGLDEKSVLVVSDSRGGNTLNFRVGDDVYKLMPRTFWIELQTRFGNLYYVRENGEDNAVIDSLAAVKTCLVRGGCSVVPGLPEEQWILTLTSSIIGGVICGFAGQYRKPNGGFAWQWALIFSPLWGILFFAFGVAPVVTRTAEWVPLLRNCAGFIIGVLVAYLTPVLGQSNPSEEL